MEILIVGATREAYELIAELRKAGHKIILADDDEKRSREFSKSPFDIAIHTLDPLDYYQLREIGLTNADAVIALHPSDAVNVAVCVYARKLNVPKIIAVFSEGSIGDALVEMGISGASVTRGREIARSVLESLFDVKITDLGNYYLVVIDSMKKDAVVGMSIEEIEEKVGKTIAILDREGNRVERRRDETIARGEVLLVLVPREGAIKALNSLT
ncbi:MAG: NAD-binding protein [Acidilobaceae archaeon]|nr:NAD-binding protein [Acidilobaceae archaeon]MCX8165988.1 NAD-binding protein [Acidilobaceae archaeon]MDW7974631.1 NAD-binding protein [Sulfolobales archaeon]